MCRPWSRDQPFEVTAAAGVCMSSLARAHPHTCIVWILKQDKQTDKQTQTIKSYGHFGTYLTSKTWIWCRLILAWRSEGTLFCATFSKCQWSWQAGRLHLWQGIRSTASAWAVTPSRYVGRTVEKKKSSRIRWHPNVCEPFGIPRFSALIRHILASGCNWGYWQLLFHWLVSHVSGDRCTLYVLQATVTPN